MTYGSWFRDQRQQAGLSPEDMGAAIDLSSSYVLKIEYGRVRIPYAPLRSKIHEVFGTSDMDPSVFPYLTDADRRTAIGSDAFADLDLGERLDRCLSIAEPSQRRFIWSLVEMIQQLVLSNASEVAPDPADV